ncbi:hypothetical protein CANARDRAFT_26373 [[Candida] arabinofermentans NRRL YB-2248]|uniref:Uncharacterized protein n=1 Tax=[Candida] arabinofermentans NRRL YB-2248 TaxID=983967 RepID=A0A1E4T911_9ASCO|nr:hypothetical protein CANARDRAFT_26373 [[Candida] arabinofermentans NRRL YB-2248]
MSLEFDFNTIQFGEPTMQKQVTPSQQNSLMFQSTNMIGSNGSSTNPSYSTFNDYNTSLNSLNFMSVNDFNSDLLDDDSNDLFKSIDAIFPEINTKHSSFNNQQLHQQQPYPYQQQQQQQQQHQQQLQQYDQEQIIGSYLNHRRATEFTDSPNSSSSSSLFDNASYSPVINDFQINDKTDSYLPNSWKDFKYSTINQKDLKETTINNISTSPHQIKNTPSNSIDQTRMFHSLDDDYNNVKTIDIVELTKPVSTKRSPILKSQSISFTDSNLHSATSPLPTSLASIPEPVSSIELSLSPAELGESNDIHLNTSTSSSISSFTTLSQMEDDDSPESYDDYNSERRNPLKRKRDKIKKISDSRLSLAQLSHVLHLSTDLQETAKREKQILSILRNDLGFPLGEKTWIRDTPSKERELLVERLWRRVEEVHQYGYSRETLSIIIRRASYYLMQGRLRRERRMEKKKAGDSLIKRKNAKSTTD